MINLENNSSIITVAKAGKLTKIPLSVIKKYADSKYNRPISFKEEIIPIHDIEEFMRDTEEYMGLYYYLKSMAQNNNKVDFSYSRCRKEAIAFLKRNEWFDASVINAQDLKYNIDVREDYYIKNTEVSCINNKWTQLWIDGYGKSDSERILLLANAYSEKFPYTTAQYLAFAEESKIAHKKSTLQLLDYLLFIMKREIFDYSDTEIEHMIKGVEEAISQSAALLFSKYLDSVIKTHSTKFISRFKAQRKKNGNVDPSPYTLENYTKIASIVFGKESWEKNNLVNKALANKKFAKIWIYSAIQFVSAWRKKDIHQLPLPDITISQEEILIEMNRDPSLTFFNQFTLETLDMLKFNPRKAAKTNYSNSVTRLELYLPPSLVGPIGLFIAIYLSHRAPGEVMDTLGENNGNLLDYSTYFGEEFMKATDQKCLSNRRMNKSYLQAVEMFGNNNPALGNPGGYLLAALCRNHSWKKVDELTRTTSIYLEGEERMLYNKEFILLELFERGPCSFLIRYLIMALTDDNFNEVSFQDETQIINAMGLSLRHIESFSKMFIKSSQEAREVVKSLISTREVDNKEQFILMVLHNTACGAAPDKGEHGMCLLAAANKECIYPHRENCWACEYLIVTTPMLIELANAYKAVLECEKTAIYDVDKSRYEEIGNKLKERIVGVFAYLEENCNEIQKSLLLNLTNYYKE